MDYDKIKLMCQEDRDEILKSELSQDKLMFIDKYGLKCNKDLMWEVPKGNYPQRPICKHFLLKKWNLIQTIFYMNRLCYAKIKYFSDNWSEFLSYKHDGKLGFIECPLWDMEFIKHDKTGNMVDLRWLKGITDINVFRQWCKEFTEAE